MSSNRKIIIGCLFASLCLSFGTGCLTTVGPNLGPFGVPIPISPYFQKKKEDKHWMHERYERVPILPPLTPGGPDKAIDPPSDDQVMRVLETIDPVQGGLPFLHETQINNVLIQKEQIADFIDDPRVYPLLGPAQLHHSRWKCTVYYTRVTRVGWPLPHTLADQDAREVVYIDQDHFHQVGNVDGGQGHH